MRKPRAIVLDDDEFIRALLTAFLSREGFDVLAYGEPGFCSIYHHENCTQGHRCADLIITDLWMPNMTGIEFLRRQSQRGCLLEARNKAVVSGGFRNEDVTALKEMGCHFFKKPFSLQELSGWIRDCQQRFDLEETLEFVERRNEDRVTAEGDLVCSLGLDHGEDVRGVVVNTSDRGLCVVVPKKVRPGLTVRIRSALGGICETAVVRWVREDHPDRFIAGLLCTART